MKLKYLLVKILLLTFISVTAQSNSKKIAELDAYIQKGIELWKPPGFAVTVVKDGEIIGRGHNSVLLLNDPTAHAEVMAIRDACKRLGDFQITDCDLYTSCEPCPMCLGAIYWARPDKVYYGSNQSDAANIGFDGEVIT